MALPHRLALVACAGMLASAWRTPSPDAGRFPRCELPIGATAVGFSRLLTADSTRPLSDGSPRPMPVGIWYPAHTSSRAPLHYRDYLLGERELTTTSAESSHATGVVDALVSFLSSQGASAEALEGWLDRPMQARPDAVPLGRRHPAILLAQGNGESAPDQAPLAEFLAAHGYVVATLPSPMRITGPLTEEREVGRRAEEQADDLEYLRGILARRKDVDPSRMAAVGHSFGARAALLLAMRDSTLRAVVSLDGGIGTATGASSMAASRSYRPAAARAPLLHFYEALDEYMAPDLRQLYALSGADRWFVGTVAMHHHHFTSFGAASCTDPALRAVLRASDTTAVAAASVSLATLSFLDAYLKDQPSVARDWTRGASWTFLGPTVHLPRGSQ